MDQRFSSDIGKPLAPETFSQRSDIFILVALLTLELAIVMFYTRTLQIYKQLQIRLK